MKKLLISLILVDQVVRNLIRFLFGFDQEIYTMGDWFTLMYFKNRSALATEIVIIGMVIISLIIIYKLLWNVKKIPLFVPFFIAGVVCNMLDGMVFGYVVDYIRFFKSPIFNLADIYIAIGFILMGKAIYGSAVHTAGR